MILGEKELRKIYPDFNEKCYQPDGIDLQVGDVYSFETATDVGLYGDSKILPKLKKLSTINKKLKSEQIIEVFVLRPNTSYSITIDRDIEIPENIMQLYIPRSSLIRANIDLKTAVGDSSFKGRLQFTIRNNNDFSVTLGKGERFCQLVCFEVKNSGIYNGQYQEF